MKRLLTNAVIFASGLMVSSQLLALGLGELTLESSLSQPLKAEIQLVDTRGLTQWDVKPSLANQEDFDRAGVERVFFLTKIDFSVEGDRIVLSTTEAINEPFLNFLVELNWPSGRVLREYTVLLDPPTYDEANYEPLVVTPESEVSEEELEVATPEEPALVNKWDEPAKEGTYKVQPNDTLWAIALDSRPSTEITPQQMMLAIQESNPQAFIDGNINRLKSHHVLRIPDEQKVRSIGMAAAVAEVNRQNQALAGTTSAQYDATGRTGSMSGEQTNKSGGEVRLLTANDEDAAEASTSGDVEDGSDLSRQALENDLAIALENVDKTQRNNEELTERLSSLEQQIETLQRLISLKDDELAELQAGGVAASDDELEQPVSEETGETDFNFEDEESALNEESLAEETQAEEAQAGDDNAIAAAEQADADAEAKEQERRERLDAIMAEQAQQEEQKKLPLLDQLLENPLIPAGAAVALLLIVLLVARLLKKPKATDDNNNDDDPDDDSMLRDIELSEGSLDDFNFAEDDQDLQSLDQFDAEEDLSPTQQEPSDGSAQTEDVITESDIYIAFGNFDRATQILKDAIDKEPQRSDLHLKLLEVFVETDDAKQFANTEAQILSLGDNEAISEAANMRQRLSAPIEPAAGAAPAQTPAPAPEETAMPAEEIDTSFDFSDSFATDDLSTNDLSTNETQPEADSGELNLDLSEEFDEGLDFADALDFDDKDAEVVDFNSKEEDIPTLDLEEGPAESAPEDTSTEDLSNDLEFSFDEPADLSSAESNTESSPELDIESMNSNLEEEATAEDDNSLDFDMDFDTDLKPADSTETPSSNENDVEPLEFDMSGGSDDIEGLDGLEDILDSKEGSSDDSNDLSFDLDNVAESDSSAEESLDLDLSDFDTGSSDSELPDFSDDELSFDLGGDTDDTADVEIPEPESAPELTPEPEAATESAPEPSASNEIDLDELAASENEFDFLAGTDECATKLDLAQAYIDMEDGEGAKELLQEVMDEGSDQQKSQARELLANLA